MKLLIRKHGGEINKVLSSGYYTEKDKTEAEVLEEVERYNAANERLKYHFDALDVPAEMEEAIAFLLGEGKYAERRCLNDIYIRLGELVESLDEIECDVNYMTDEVRRAIKKSE